jgi:FtsP/CotA-like multicopper oxidase with cupredoxin domain
VDRDVAFSMDFSTRPPTGLINGRAYDPERADITIARGTTETWRVTNADPSTPHSFHPHLVHFRVLERDGGPPTADDAGLKDTIHLAPGSTATVQATFDGEPGRYAFHCHMLDHSRVGMMAQFEIVP